MTPGTYTRVDVRPSYWSRREGDTWIWWTVPAHTVFFSVPWVRKGIMGTTNSKTTRRKAKTLMFELTVADGSAFVYSDFAVITCPLCRVSVPVKTRHTCGTQNAAVAAIGKALKL